MISINDFDIFKNNQCSLQETSKDTSGEKPQYMTTCTKRVVNFDNVKTKLLNSFGESEEHAKSVDALVIDKDIIYFIEFKNGDVKLEKRFIPIKARDSILIFNHITNNSIKFNREKCIFILVYNEDKNTFDTKTQIALARADRSNVNYDIYDLAGMKGFCYKDVLTLNKKQFDDQIISGNSW